MNRSEAQDLLDIIYKGESSQEEKEFAYSRLSELFKLLPEE
ncbi:MAG: hypothetical protein E6772_17980 [Dysgonomonas sp.]|nr:hypothetical protein [Dysgonomonas sp.]